MTTTRLIALAAATLTAVLAPGCATDRETHALVESISVAAVAGNAQHLAECIRADLGAAKDISDADKAPLLARADVLEAHALKLGNAVGRFDPAKDKDYAATLANLKVRAEALKEEMRNTWRAWGYWQAQHGLRSPDEIAEVFDFTDLTYR